MSSQDDDLDNRVAGVVLVAAIFLAVGVAVGFGIQTARGGARSTTAAVSTPVAPRAAAAAPAAGDASVVVEYGVVKFYFASGNADLAPGALDALVDAIAAAKAGQRLVISGFHDATGNPALNAELARQRALSVRDTLVGAGVAATAIELKKPEETMGSGNNAEARRVEVVIAE